MQNFNEAFFSGIEAARQSKRAQREIDNVMREFAESLESATGGRLTVVLKDRGTSLGDVLAQRTADAKRTKLIVVKELDSDLPPDPEASQDVAQFRRAVEGYPCWLIYGGQEFICSDRPSLEGELATLAASPRMGQAILRVIDARNPAQR